MQNLWTLAKQILYSSFYLYTGETRGMIADRRNQKDFHSRQSAYRRNWIMLRKYGLSLGAFEFLSCLLLGRCEACGTISELCVDHNHMTNEFRGLLCRPDNAHVERIQKYLETHK